MPANGRWDLIRRLKINYAQYSCLHERLTSMNSYSFRKRSHKVTQYFAYDETTQRFLCFILQLLFHLSLLICHSITETITPQPNTRLFRSPEANAVTIDFPRGMDIILVNKYHTCQVGVSIIFVQSFRNICCECTTQRTIRSESQHNLNITFVKSQACAQHLASLLCAIHGCTYEQISADQTQMILGSVSHTPQLGSLLEVLMPVTY